jgi:hypothetical protein
LLLVLPKRNTNVVGELDIRELTIHDDIRRQAIILLLIISLIRTRNQNPRCVGVLHVPENGSATLSQRWAEARALAAIP